MQNQTQNLADALKEITMTPDAQTCRRLASMALDQYEAAKGLQREEALSEAMLRQARALGLHATFQQRVQGSQHAV